MEMDHQHNKSLYGNMLAHRHVYTLTVRRLFGIVSHRQFRRPSCQN